MTEPNPDDKGNPDDDKTPKPPPDPKNPTTDPPDNSGSLTEEMRGEMRKMLQEELAKLGPGTSPERRVDIERQAEAMVQRAASRFERQQEMERLKKEVEDLKKPIEKAPIKTPLLRKILFGEDE